MHLDDEEVTDDKSLSKGDRKRLQVENANHKSLRVKHIKLTDKACNIQDIATSPPSGWSMDRKLEYVKWSKDVINEIRGTNAELEKYFDELCSETETLLKRNCSA